MFAASHTGGQKRENCINNLNDSPVYKVHSLAKYEFAEVKVYNSEIAKWANEKH